MDALVWGCGSIGKRHVAALLARPDVERVTVVSSRPEYAEPFAGEARVTVATPDARVEADLAIVANDTDRHLATALALVERGVDTLVEKPVSHTLAGADALADAARASGAHVFVGYNLRFLPAARRLRDLVADGGLGRVWTARFEAGQWLPDWRPGRDYRETYSASRARGGGVGLDLSHEVDAMRFVFGEPVGHTAVERKVSALEIDSADVFEGIYKLAGGGLATVHLDYLRPRRARVWRVLGSGGEAVCDVAEGRLTVDTGGGPQAETDPALFDVAATYAAQMDAFVAARQGAATDLATLADGLAVLELLEAGDA